MKYSGEFVLPDSETPYEIPSNWVWTKLKDVIEPMQTLSPHTLDGEYFNYIDIDAINNKKQSINQVKKIKIENAPSRARRKVSKDDVIISLVRPNLKNIAKIDIQNEKLIASTAFYVCSPRVILDAGFLYGYLCSSFVTQYLTKLTKGDNSPSVRNIDFEELPFPLPPIEEQKRIAEKTENLLSKIENAKWLIEEAKDSFAIRRAGILDKALRGELTSNWRSENENKLPSSRKRFESIKKERYLVAETKKEVSDITKMFKDFELEESVDKNDWLYLKANMFCYNISSGGTPSKHLSKKGEIPFLKVYNIVNNEIDFLHKPQYIPEEIHKSKLKKSILKPNDVIMNIVGPPLKKIAMIPNDFPEMNMNQAIVRFRPVKYVLPKYLYYCLQYDETLKDVLEKTKGVVGQVNISISQSRSLIIPLPSIEEQNEIVLLLNSLIEKEERVITLMPDSEKIEELKQSILLKAYQGKLGTNDPSDESLIELFKQTVE